MNPTLPFLLIEARGVPVLNDILSQLGPDAPEIFRTPSGDALLYADPEALYPSPYFVMEGLLEELNCRGIHPRKVLCIDAESVPAMARLLRSGYMHEIYIIDYASALAIPINRFPTGETAMA